MTAPIRSALLLNPWLSWLSLARKTAEMMVASAQVIHHRTGRMAAAGHKPSARDRREFALMSQEKIDATLESAQAMSSQMMATNARLGLRYFQLMSTSTAALMSLASSRTVSQTIARHAKLVRTVSAGAPLSAAVSKAAVKIAHRGLKPMHSRANANAKRLGRR